MFLKILLLQSTVAADSLSTPKVGSQSMLDIILNSGTFGILIVLIQIILMFLAVYIFVERYLAIKKAGRIDQNFMNNIRMSVQSGNIAAARALCQSTDTPVARMVEKGLQRIGKPLRDIDAAIENVGNIEIFKLEKNLASLASISGAAPMLGFLGTVTGMILAFYQMSTAETITPSLLAGGIYQALLTTAFGLGVGIFALIGYNLLVSNVDKVVYQMEQSTVDFMDFLQEPTA